MIAFLFVISGIVSFVWNNYWLLFAPSFISVLYSLAILPAVFSYLLISKEEKESLTNKLSHYWKEPDEIANYITKYMVAFISPTSSLPRSHNAGIIFVWSILFAIYAFVRDYNNVIIYSYLCSSVLIWPIFRRSNWPRHIIESFLKDKKSCIKSDAFNKSLELAVVSYVAFLKLNEKPDVFLESLVDNRIFNNADLVNVLNKYSLNFVFNVRSQTFNS